MVDSSRIPVVFFSMPFGIKQTAGGDRDFDEMWHHVLRQAVPGGWRGVRIDEVSEAGAIPEQFMHFLRTADVAVFDITTANPNVLYELGVRDVFAPGRKVLVAMEGTSIPFNVQTERVLFYPSDRASTSIVDFIIALRSSIGAARENETVPTGRPRLTGDDMRRQLERARTLPALVALWEFWKREPALPADPLLALARGFSEGGRVELAVAAARRAYQDSPNSWDVARALGWYLRRSGSNDEAAGFLRQALALNPNDVEAHGMLGGIHKREAIAFAKAGNDSEATRFFQSARDSYAEAAEIDPGDTYAQVNLGAILIATDGPSDQNPGYEAVIAIVRGKPAPVSTWDLLALGEALLCVGRVEEALDTYAEAKRRTDFTSEMDVSAADQLLFLQHLGVSPDRCTAALDIIAGRGSRLSPDVVFIHISDMHFGAKPNGTEMHRFIPRGGIYGTRALGQHIVDECRSLRSIHPAAEVFLVISGDTGFQALESEYHAAQVQIDYIMRELAIDVDHCVIVPGNHDVNWSLSGLSKARRFDNYLVFLRSLYGQGALSVHYPHLKFSFDIAGKRPEPHEIISLHRSDVSRVVIVGMNSCVVEDDKRHFGAIGESQIKLIEEALSDLSPEWLRVAVLHHHVLPMEREFSVGSDENPSMDGTIVRDYALVEVQLHRLGFDVVMHGHKHEPGIRISRLVNESTDGVGKPIVICGAGSTGVQKSELRQSRGNHFAIYRIPAGVRREGRTFLHVEWRELPYDDTLMRWNVSGRWEIPG